MTARFQSVIDERGFMRGVMRSDGKSNADLSPQDEVIEKIRRSPSLECKIDRNTESRYDNEGENMDGGYDVLQDFQPVAFFFLRRERLPRRWFIRLVTWPYPFFLKYKNVISC